MRAVTKEKLDQAREEIRKMKDKRNAYVKSWRQTQRTQRRVSYFIEEYVREKYENIYSEALNFYSTLDSLYPEKIDLRKTKEFREWKQTIPDDINRETLTAVTTVNQAAQNQINSNTSIDQAEQQQTDNFVLRIPLIPRSSTPQAPPPEDRTVEIPQPTTPQEMSAEIPPLQPPTLQEMSAEIPPSQPSQLEIGAEYTIEEIQPLQSEMQAENDEGITDQRIREIIQELQNDPDLNGLFNDIQPTEQNDEGIELPTIEEEMRVDLALIDHDPDFHAWSNMEVDSGLVDQDPEISV